MTEHDLPRGRATLSVVEQLRSSIRGGWYAPGACLPAERELASAYQTARVTVRRALEALELDGLIERTPQGRPRVAVGTARRGAGGAAHVQVEHDHVCLLTPVPFAAQLDPETENLSNMVASVHQDLAKEGLRVTYTNTYRRAAEFVRDFGSLVRPYYGGVIYFPASDVAPGALRALESCARPVVLVCGYTDQSSDRVSTVERDDRAGAVRAVEHLVSLGHRRIVHLTYVDELEWVRQRIEGVERALAAAGIDPAGRVCRACAVGEPETADPAALHARLRERVPADTTAIFAANDALAAAAMRWAAADGRRVPQDLSVVGFDNVTAAVRANMTTISHMSTEIGHRAAAIVRGALEHPDVRQVRHELVDPVLVVRGSTGPAPRASRASRAAKKS